MISLESVVVVSSRQASRVLGDETVILDNQSGTYFSLSAVGARIWSLLSDPRRVQDLKAAILDEFEVDPQTCERDLLALLETLSARALIEVVP
jgi:hypothetical protein